MSAEDKETPARLGRKRDHTRDAEILDTALDVLADVGYANMTMDMVATRAKAGKATVYRRWPSKEALVIGAVAHMKLSQIDLERLPETGTLRGDVLALFKPQSIEEGQRKLKVMAGVASLLSSHAELAEAVNAAITEPWVDANRALIQRAITRGEISASANVEAVSQVIPSMAAYRALIQRKTFEWEFLVTLVDDVLLPTLHGATNNTPPACAAAPSPHNNKRKRPEPASQTDECQGNEGDKP